MRVDSSEASASYEKAQDARKKRKRDVGEALAELLGDCHSLMEAHKEKNDESPKRSVRTELYT